MTSVLKRKQGKRLVDCLVQVFFFWRIKPKLQGWCTSAAGPECEFQHTEALLRLYQSSNKALFRLYWGLPAHTALEGPRPSVHQGAGGTFSRERQMHTIARLLRATHGHTHTCTRTHTQIPRVRMWGGGSRSEGEGGLSGIRRPPCIKKEKKITCTFALGYRGQQTRSFIFLYFRRHMIVYTPIKE